MKKRFFATEFAVVLLFFVVPPILSSVRPDGDMQLHVSPAVFVYASCALVLLWQMKRQPEEGTLHDESSDSRLVFFVCQGAALVTFGALMVVAGLISLSGTYLLHLEERVHVLPPETWYGWMYAAAGTVCASFYEEVIYRVYLPHALFTLLGARFELLCEAAAVALFALAHRYLGFPAVVNSLFAGMILRRCYVKTGKVWTNVSAHAAYNIVMLFLTLQ